MSTVNVLKFYDLFFFLSVGFLVDSKDCKNIFMFPANSFLGAIKKM